MNDGLFVSYRRSDTELVVAHLVQELAERFGPEQVFRDVDSNRVGHDYPQQIGDALEGCRAVVAVIGPHWATVVDDNGRRRLENPDDWVRNELATALANGKVVLPVLANGAEMPPGPEVPEALRKVTKLHARVLRESDWRYDVTRLIEDLEQAGVRPSPEAGQQSKRLQLIRARKTYERMFRVSRPRLYDCLIGTLGALHYPIVVKDARAAEAFFLWGDDEKPMGRLVAAAYNKVAPNGVRATLLDTRAGMTTLTLDVPSIKRILLVYPLFAPAFAAAAVTERKIVKGFFDEVQRFSDGHTVSQDPAAIVDHLLKRWTDRRKQV